MFGLCAVILAEDGLVWNMRILSDGPLGRKYGYSETASKEAPRKMGDIVRLIDDRLAAQEAKGSKYLVGDALSAVDIYWATISMLVIPAPPEIMSRTKQNEGMLAMFEAVSMVPEVSQAVSARLQAHRDYILHTYCETPAVLGGDAL
jgi:glutathione S-transferase